MTSLASVSSIDRILLTAAAACRAFLLALPAAGPFDELDIDADLLELLVVFVVDWVVAAVAVDVLELELEEEEGEGEASIDAPLSGSLPNWSSNTVRSNK